MSSSSRSVRCGVRYRDRNCQSRLKGLGLLELATTQLSLAWLMILPYQRVRPAPGVSRTAPSSPPFYSALQKQPGLPALLRSAQPHRIHSRCRSHASSAYLGTILGLHGARAHLADLPSVFFWSSPDSPYESTCGSLTCRCTLHHRIHQRRCSLRCKLETESLAPPDRQRIRFARREVLSRRP